MACTAGQTTLVVDHNGRFRSCEMRPIIGDPDHVARQLIELSGAGLSGIAVSLVNFADELRYLCAEVLPRLEQAGLRVPAERVTAA